MKTQSHWLQLLAKAGSGHPAACFCDRCNYGTETFLLPSDIDEIQRDAREGMVPLEDISPFKNTTLRLLAEVRNLRDGLNCNHAMPPKGIDTLHWEGRSPEEYRQDCALERAWTKLIDAVDTDLEALRAKHPNLFTK